MNLLALLKIKKGRTLELDRFQISKLASYQNKQLNSKNPLKTKPKIHAALLTQLYHKW